MEILSDAVFKGNVRIKGETSAGIVRLYNTGGDSDSYITASEFSLINDKIHADFNYGLRVSSNATFKGNVVFENSIGVQGSLGAGSISLSCSKIETGPYIQCLQKKSGTIALTSDILEVTGSKSFYTSFKLPTTIPASCGKFSIGLNDYASSYYTPDVKICGAKLEGNGAPFVLNEWCYSRRDAVFRIPNEKIQNIRVTGPNDTKDLALDVYGCSGTSTEFIVEKSTNYELPENTRFTIYYVID